MFEKMKRSNIISLLAVLALASACTFLDPYPAAVLDGEYVSENQTTMRGIVDKCYDYITSNYNNNEGAYLDCLTDNAAETSTTSTMARFAVGTTLPSEDLFATYWSRDYKAIYNLNFFIQDRRGFNLRYMTDEHLDELLKKRLWGEAHALRAWFYWDLLKKFGGRSTDGDLLGVPLILEPVDITSQGVDELGDMEFRRATYDECVEQILNDFDTAIAYLPKAHRDFLVEETRDLRVDRKSTRLNSIT